MRKLFRAIFLLKEATLGFGKKQKLQSTRLKVTVAKGIKGTKQ